MRWTGRAIGLALAMALAAVSLGGCGKGGDRQTKTGAGGGKQGSGSISCPSEGDVSAAVGAELRSKQRAVGCYYEADDNETSVSIMNVSPGNAAKLMEEMKASAKPYGAEVTPVNVGDKGFAWGTPGWGQGFAVSGDRAYMLEVTTVGGSKDMKAAVVQILKLMIG